MEITAMVEYLYLATTFAMGLFAGALLTEACILVPYWQRMQASDFFALHGSLGPKLFRYFAPLTVLAVSMSISSFSAALVTGEVAVWQGATAGLCTFALLLFFFYFKNANAKFATHSISDNELVIELNRWAIWHWIRTASILTAFACSLMAI